MHSGSSLLTSFTEKVVGAIPRFVSKNEAVCCEVQTHFGSSRLASFIKKVLGAFSRFMRPKTKLFAVKFMRILEVLALRGL